MLRLLTMRRIVRLVLVLSMFVWLGSIRAADLDPKAIAIHLPKDIKWVASPSGSENAVLVGDPDKPGLYVVLTKWTPHHNSRPHFHSAPCPGMPRPPLISTFSSRPFLLRVPRTDREPALGCSRFAPYC